MGASQRSRDPNTGVRLWRSGAIIEYLVDTCDYIAKLTYISSPERYLVKQWLHFQTSGQAAWREKFHHEKVKSAADRYKDQTRVGGLDAYLKGRGKECLVGDKCLGYDDPLDRGDEAGSLQIEKGYPIYHVWHERLTRRLFVQKVVQDRQKAMSG